MRTIANFAFDLTLGEDKIEAQYNRMKWILEQMKKDGIPVETERAIVRAAQGTGKATPETETEDDDRGPNEKAYCEATGRMFLRCSQFKRGTPEREAFALKLLDEWRNKGGHSPSGDGGAGDIAPVIHAKKSDDDIY